MNYKEQEQYPELADHLEANITEKITLQVALYRFSNLVCIDKTSSPQLVSRYLSFFVVFNFSF